MKDITYSDCSGLEEKNFVIINVKEKGIFMMERIVVSNRWLVKEP